MALKPTQAKPGYPRVGTGKSHAFKAGRPDHPPVLDGATGDAGAGPTTTNYPRTTSASKPSKTGRRDGMQDLSGPEGRLSTGYGVAGRVLGARGYVHPGAPATENASEGRCQEIAAPASPTAPPLPGARGRGTPYD